MTHTPGPCLALYSDDRSTVLWHGAHHVNIAATADDQVELARRCSDASGGEIEINFVPLQMAFSSPDLLAACEAVYAAFGLKDTLPLGFPPELELMLKDAIAKATGGVA